MIRRAHALLRAYFAAWLLVAIIGIAFVAGYWAAVLTAVAMIGGMGS